MAYRLHYEAPIEKQVQQLTGEELDYAAGQLRKTGKSDGNEAIHEARKSLKKTRALLRLVQPYLGPIYRQENDCLRQIGRELSEFRDAGAILETLRDLRKKHADQLKGPEIDAADRAILKRKQDLEDAGVLEKTLPRLADGIEKAAGRAKRLAVAADGFGAIATGLRNRFRRGRKAMLRARLHPAAENYHEWRKRVKDHWYHARLLEISWMEMMKAYADQLDMLQEWLGDDHNLTVVRDVLVRELNFREEDATMSKLLPVILEEQEKLREQSFALGRRIYAEKAGRVVQRLESLWNAGRETER
ncbi:MAG TPA: CHAD domain-containing protein [Bryobacteraceae bacterium]|jgi:CHAD domain-containing protein|nr:CHAD domain-containing protein [Bryobacteraceae bacterium]